MNLILLIIFFGAKTPLSAGTEHAKKLHDVLFSDYDYRIRPISNSSERVTVKLKLKLSQLIGVDEKNQMMTTNVWLRQEWYDHYLQWNASNYGNVDQLHVPSSKIWKPDIALYNNGDGSYQITHDTKAAVRNDGLVVWEPPAIYKSSCDIDVEFFPFDEQTCELKFSSWTYVRSQVDLKHIDQADISGDVDIPNAIDMTEYYASFIWDVMAVPAQRHEVKYLCCPEIFPDITFYITIRRKTLFYTVNLIIPCVAISFLTVLVFYLPSDSGEKITLCISILLSLTVFFLLLSELIPPTSLVIPLIGKYLLFTMILVTLSIIITIISLNLHNRSSATHHMPDWVRVVFLEMLPYYLLMKRPDMPTKEPSTEENQPKLNDSKKSSKLSLAGSLKMRLLHTQDKNDSEIESLLVKLKKRRKDTKEEILYKKQLISSGEENGLLRPEVEQAILGIHFIVNHLKEEDNEKKVQEDWRYVSMVVDRLFLWLFTISCCVGTMTIILQAPTLYDGKTPLK